MSMRLEVRPNKFKTAVLILLSLGLLACMYLLVVDPRPRIQIIGYLGICVFVYSFFSFFKQLLSSEPSIIIDQQGINDTRTSMGTISWDDILSISIGEIRGVRLLSIKSSNPQKYLNRVSFVTNLFSGFNRQLGFSEITISSSGLSHSPDKILLFIKQSGFLK